MKLRLQFGAVFAALLMAGTACSPAFGQRFMTIGQNGVQTPAQQRRAARQLRREQMLPNRPAANDSAANGFRPNGPGLNPNRLPPKAIERLQDMPPERQEQFLQNNQRFQNLPPQQQAQIRQSLQAWNRLTPSQQQDLRERQHVWEQMTPDQQRDVRQNLLPRWQQLPPVRRQAIMQRLHSLRDMSEADRQAKLNDPAFVEGLNPEDRETLQQLAHLHVGMAPDPPGM
jgi:hypothetical protein